MKKILVFLLVIAPIFVYGQLSSEHNYIHTVNYTIPVQDGNQHTVSDNDKMQSVTYYDGMSRPIQSIAVKQGGNSENIIQHYQYDNMSRQVRNYLPYAKSTANINPLAITPNALQQTSLYYNVSNPFSETVFEKSSLSRPIESASEGEDWSLTSTNTTKISYKTNELNEVKQFRVVFPQNDIEKTQLIFDGYYYPRELYKSVVKGVNWQSNQEFIKDHTTESFTDKSGKQILLRTYDKNIAFDTYYVYDNFGNLTYVIPPKASDEIVTFGSQDFRIDSQTNYSWTQLVSVDATFAEDYNKKLLNYDNKDILNADLANAYGGQGGFTVTTFNDNEIVTLNISFSADQPFELKSGEIASLKDFGTFKDAVLGELKGLDYEYVFLVRNNAIVVEGKGALNSISQTFTSNTTLNYSQNYPWTSYTSVSDVFQFSYEEQLKSFSNDQILSANITNAYGGQGGLNISIDENEIITLNFNSSLSTPLSLKKGLVIPLNTKQRVQDRDLGSISGAGYSYHFLIRNNALYIEGNGLINNGFNVFLSAPVPPPATTNPAGISGLCYIYHYDSRNRLIEKITPGKGWEYIVYDKLNRPILSQNALQRVNGEWIYLKYDKFNRPVYKGTFNLGAVTIGGEENAMRKQHQSTVDSQLNPFWNEKELSSNSSVGIKYSNSAYPTNILSQDLLAINFYDDYQNIDEPTLTLPANTVIYNQTISNNTKSLPTVSKVKVLETNHWISGINYYDDKGRPIYGATKNNYLDILDVIKYKIDFIGKILVSERTHTKGWNNAITFTDYYTYDHSQRLKTHIQSINNSDLELILALQYDELGRIKSKKVGGSAASTIENSSGLQTIDYSFNIKGWLESINDGNANNGDLFGFRLNYHETALPGAKSFYDGKISESHFVSARDHKTRSYKYEYDALSRIKSATYHGNYAVPGLTDIEDYSLNNVSYDKNSNITALSRTGLTAAVTGTPVGIDLIDRLSYSYAPLSNQLLRVSDAATTDGFKNGYNIDNDYEYDVNGNLKKDKNKGIIGIEYNYMDLPTQITFNDEATSQIHTITYVYDANGNRVKKSINDAVTIYTHNLVYEKVNSSSLEILKYIGFSEGYIEPTTNGNFNYIYQYKDNLGNIRLSFSDLNNDGNVNPSEIIQSINYYPFGLEHSYGQASPMSVVNGLYHAKKYNGQELEQSFGLNVTEMDFRQYDNALGRFNAIDKLAAYEYNNTPYHFAGNNPISYADPTGLLPWGGETPILVDVSYNGYIRGAPHWSDEFNNGRYSGGGGGGLDREQQGVWDSVFGSKYKSTKKINFGFLDRLNLGSVGNWYDFSVTLTGDNNPYSNLVNLDRDWYSLSGEARLALATLPQLAFLPRMAFPDAVSIELNFGVGAGSSTNTSPIGGIFKLNPNLKGSFGEAFFQGSAGVGKVGGAVSAKITEYYIVGPTASELTIDDFKGFFLSGEIGVAKGPNLAIGGSLSRPQEGAYIIGVSYSIGAGFGATLSISGGYLDFYKKNKR